MGKLLGQATPFLDASGGVSRLGSCAAAAVPGNVRIVTKDSVRVKRILAEVQVQASVDQVQRHTVLHPAMLDIAAESHARRLLLPWHTGWHRTALTAGVEGADGL